MYSFKRRRRLRANANTTLGGYAWLEAMASTMFLQLVLHTPTTLKLVGVVCGMMWLMLGVILLCQPPGFRYTTTYTSQVRRRSLPPIVARPLVGTSVATVPPQRQPVSPPSRPKQCRYEHVSANVSSHTRKPASNVSNDVVLDLSPGRSLAVPEDRLWFYSHLSHADIWDTSVGDRVLEQLAHMAALPHRMPQASLQPPKFILMLLPNHDPPDMFRRVGCPVDNCLLSRNASDHARADAVVASSGAMYMPKFRKHPGQLWIFFDLESPEYTGAYPVHTKDQFNWTASYRSDSTIVTPYAKFAPYHPDIRLTTQSRDYAANKTKMAAWVVSNCYDCNGRMAYAKALGRHMPLDIYGRCGKLKCPSGSSCDDTLKNYKFYLAFENSNCRHYVTEKLFTNALGNDLLPIVMGGHPDDYLQVAPPHSYIHVDDFSSPKALAEYLQYLDRNHTAYNEYFQWKGTGTFINTQFMCRLCAMLHERPPDYNTWIPDINAWWRGPGVCRPGYRPSE